MHVFYQWKEVLMLQVEQLNSAAYFLLTFWLFIDLSAVMLLVFFRVLAK